MTIIWMLVGLQIKHFVADYLLQWPSMIRDKCYIFRPGGYLHAGIHIACTLPVLWLAGVHTSLIWAILAGEFIVHYITDYAKAWYGTTRRPDVSSGSFWMAHGFDQLIHHLTYATILGVVVWRVAF